MSEWSMRATTMAGLQTLEHVTDFTIDKSHPLQRNKEHQLASNFVLIILNYKLPAFTPLLWEQAQLRICADGGANRLYDEFPVLFPGQDADNIRQRYVPDVIKGDLDSVRNDVRAFYEELGTSVIDRRHDQKTSDLHKCLDYVTQTVPEEKAPQLKILVVGALGGRMDHEFGNMNMLFRFPSLRIVMLNDSSLLFLLPSGFRHVIRPHTAFEGPHCGLIPLGSPSRTTTTTGLQWNLDERPMSFGTLVSSSNRIVEEEVTVVSDATLLWTSEIRQHPQLPTAINDP